MKRKDDGWSFFFDEDDEQIQFPTSTEKSDVERVIDQGLSFTHMRWVRLRNYIDSGMWNPGRETLAEYRIDEVISG